MRYAKTNSTATKSSFGRRLRTHVLVIHPDSAVLRQLGDFLGDELRVTLCSGYVEGASRCLSDPPDILVVDAAIADGPLLELMTRLNRFRCTAQLILLARPGTVVEPTGSVPARPVVADPGNPEAVRRHIRQGLLGIAA